MEGITPVQEAAIQEKLLAVIGSSDILLIVPPFARTNQAILGPHILQALAQKQGYKTDIFYMNMLLASVIGPEQYDPISYEERFRMVGERMFARSAYGLPPLGKHPETCLDEALSISGNRAQHRMMFYGLREIDFEALCAIEETCTEFIDLVAAVIASCEYTIIGCSTNYEQTNCSIALVNRIKAIRPEIITLIGGANCEEVMAEGIASLSKAIDYIFSGDSEETFSDFLQHYKAGNLPASRILAGTPLQDLDRIPLPDYDSFFTQINTFLGEHVPENVMICYETSRGCLKGQHEPCTFCALNGFNRIDFRQKTSRKVLTELEQIYAQYPDIPIWMVDNLMPISYYQNLFPFLCEKTHVSPLYYEQRADLTLTELIQLKNSGVQGIQPGIESFSTGLLKLMKKGIEVKHNVLLLRNAFSVGIYVYWNLLWGFPGDDITQYEETLSLLPLLRHLYPPMELRHLRLDRFSSYCEYPQEYQISNLRPFEAYHTIYPEGAKVDKLAYYFTAEYPCESHESQDVIQRIADEVNLWKTSWKSAKLTLMPFAGSYAIHDSRGLKGDTKTHIVKFAQAQDMMTCKQYDDSEHLQWAVAEKLGLVLDSWYVPLVTAAPELLLEFEQEHNNEFEHRKG